MAKKIIRDNPGWKRTLDNFSLYRKPGGLNLWICGGEIRNLSALAEYDFNTAWLLDTSVDDLSFLRNSKSLIQVVLRNTKNNGKILDLSGIKGKPVASLYIDNISIKSIEPVVNMKFRGLKIRNTKGVNFNLFSNLEDLNSFSAAGTDIKDVEFLKKCKKLKYVDLSNTAVDGTFKIESPKNKTMSIMISQ